MSDRLPTHQSRELRDADRRLRGIGSFTHLLWYCAGVDKRLLMQCPSSDQIKYLGIGGTVLITSLIALISGSYTFHVVFRAKHAPSSGDVETDWVTLFISIVFGIIWSLVILNIDRLIVSSTGHDEQDGEVSLKDLKRAFPRIFLGTIIGVSVSTPLELSVMKREIDAQMSRVQQRQVDKYDLEIKKQYQKKEDKLKAQVALLQQRMEDMTLSIQDRKIEIKDEAKARRADPNCKAACQTEVTRLLRSRLSEYRKFKSEQELRSLEFKGNKEILEAELKGIDDRLKREHDVNALIAQNMDGLLMPIRIAHEVGGYLPWLIMFLLLSIELSPIFFKMFMTKSTYDYLKENQHRQILADHGIQCMKDRFVDESIEHVDAIYHLPRSIFTQEMQRQAEERIWNEDLIEAKVREELDTRHLVSDHSAGSDDPQKSTRRDA